MRAAGIDVGSRFVKLVVVDGGVAVHHARAATGYDPLVTCERLLGAVSVERVLATGYGRHLLELQRPIATVTEIKAFARGARALVSGCRTVIDIGGQDTKLIALREDGQVARFEMNDRCAAGTGRFLEVMAERLGFSVEEFGATGDVGDLRLSSLCTVFAESEVVSLIGRGMAREPIAAAVHRAVAGRVAAMAARLPLDAELVFAGGCGRNHLLRRQLEQRLARLLTVPPEPELVGALGAALLAAEA